MARYSLADFVNRTTQQDRQHGLFEFESDRILEINLSPATPTLWTKTGSMIAYTGNIRFEREGVLEHGIGKFLKRTITGEGTRLTKATGAGRLYLADSGKKITLLQLNNESIYVNGNDVLAFEPSLQWDVTLMRKLAAVVSGGLFNIRFQGTGAVAITTHYDPLTLPVTPQSPVSTDPNATIAWSGTLSPEFKTDVSLKTFIGRGSGESIQMLFNGTGFVVVQPYEELPLQASQGS